MAVLKTIRKRNVYMKRKMFIFKGFGHKFTIVKEQAFSE